MNSEQKIEFKNLLIKKGIALIEERIHNYTTGMEEAQASANSETKSSAGDKYETGRSMGHLNKEMYARQLWEQKKCLAAILAVDCNRVYEKAEPGSLLECSEISFFISVGLGKIEADSRICYLVSPQSAFARSLMKKRSGDSLVFKGKILAVLALY